MKDMYSVLEGIDELRCKLQGVASMSYTIAENMGDDINYAPSMFLIGDIINETEKKIEALIEEAHAINKSNKESKEVK